MPNPGQTGADFPDPKGPKPPGISDSAWYGFTAVDSTKPLSWWTSQDKNYDPTATGYARYRSNKLDAAGNPIQGLFEHGDACPEGTTALGLDKCVSTSDPRVLGAQNQLGQSTSGPSAAPPPPPQWDAQGNFNQAGSSTGDTKMAPPGSLQDQLQQMLAGRSGLFGLTDGRTPNGGYAGTMSVDGGGNQLPTAPGINAKALSGGGLLWSQNDLGLNPRPQSAPVAPAQYQQQPQSGQQTPYTAMTSPLQQALANAKATAATPFSSPGVFSSGQNPFTPPTFNPAIQQYLNMSGQQQQKQPQQQIMAAPQQQPQSLQQSLTMRTMPTRNNPYQIS